MKVTKPHANIRVDVRIDPDKIKKVCTAEFNALTIFMKIRKISLRTFYVVWIQEKKSPRHKPEKKELQHAQELYKKLCRRFEGKTGLPLFLTTNRYDAFWSSKLKLEKNLYKYAQDIVLG